MRLMRRSSSSLSASLKVSGLLSMVGGGGGVQEERRAGWDDSSRRMTPRRGTRKAGERECGQGAVADRLHPPVTCSPQISCARAPNRCDKMRFPDFFPRPLPSFSSCVDLLHSHLLPCARVLNLPQHVSRTHARRTAHTLLLRDALSSHAFSAHRPPNSAVWERQIPSRLQQSVCPP